MTPLRTLIIEDNAPARADLARKLTAHPAVAIVGEAGTFGRARTLLALGGYDLVFLDIRLRGGNGFDLVPHIDPAARIIFVTAYDEYALRAFEVNALDYLLKPVTSARLDRALARLGETAAPATLTLHAEDMVHLRTDAGSQFIPVQDIALIQAELNYTQVHLVSGARHLVRRPLKSWADQLHADQFLRLSRDAIANRRHVQRVQRNEQKSGELWVAGYRQPVPVSRRQWPLVRTSLQLD